MKQVFKYKIFVSSPSDIEEERILIVKAIERINRIIDGIYIEVMMAKTHTYPSSGADAQQIVDDQIGLEYDIYIGILWKKFGTPTLHYNSGTEQEYYNAINAFGSKKNKKVMFYFNDAPIPIRDINTDQINLINKFKERITNDKHIYYWVYSDLSQFEGLIEHHIIKSINEIHHLNINSNDSSNLIVKSNQDKNNEISETYTNNEIELFNDEIEELGMFEYMEIAESNLGELSRVGTRLTTVMKDLSISINNRLDELKNVSMAGKVIDIRRAKTIFDLMANDILKFEERTRVEIPIFKESSNLAIKSLNEAFIRTLTFEIDDKDLDEIKEMLELIKGLRNAFEDNKNETIIMRQIVKMLPSYSTKLNKARRNSDKVLGEMIKEFKISISLLLEFENDLIENIA